MIYCPKCGYENEDDAEYCTECRASLTSTKKKYKKTQTKTLSLEKQVGDFAEEVERLGKTAGKTIERGMNNFGEEIKTIGKKVEKEISGNSKSLDESSSTSESGEYRRLYRSGKNRILGGVCGGVSEYFKMDPTLIRILWVIIVFFPPGLGILMYILFWIFVPRNPNHNWN
jgi:phage shock protein PspC (stress-responsive transcriptional regulator)/gas vesicle protein